MSKKQRFVRYRKFVYEVGSIDIIKGKSIDSTIAAKEAEKGYAPDAADRFRARARYFIDSGIIGSKEFVRCLWLEFKSDVDNADKLPTRIAGLKGLYSLTCLFEFCCTLAAIDSLLEH